LRSYAHFIQSALVAHYIEIIWTLKNNVIFADTKWIYATYRIILFGVKLQARKMRLYENKKGKSIGSGSPF
jgi:hypothetical protein